MKFTRIFRRTPIYLGLLLGLAGPSHSASDYPSKPIQLVIGFSAGGPADAIARILSQPLSKVLGTPIVIDNRPGADGVIAATKVAQSPANGYTLLLAPATHAINATLYKTAPYDSLKDFTPIVLIGDSPNIVAVHPSVPAKTISELVAYAKTKTPELAYGSSSSITYLATEMLNMNADVKMVRIPYKGAGQALPALLSGEVQVMVSSFVTLLPHVKSGKVRALAVTSPSRLAAAPDIPTVAESGQPGYSATTWYGILAPANTPPEITERVEKAVKEILLDKSVVDQLAAQGLAIEKTITTPQAFKTYMATEIDKWKRVIVLSGASAN
ncbi:tripartite tricarboxylate transporter substrate binding protein [Alicycliphilus denitrificans]|uniref:tripartite tricarboxylate transporter substrate binding protein n=1 Tax=Alicycliphilus denitrificans TaxID=179636 RepID=UPI00384E5BC3